MKHSHSNRALILVSIMRSQRVYLNDSIVLPLNLEAKNASLHSVRSVANGLQRDC